MLKHIEAFYGQAKAKRSGVPLIQHIYEGVKILRHLGAPQAAIDAFCLHPIFQRNEDLLRVDAGFVRSLDPYVVMLVMEYRNAANSWLSERVRRIHHRTECFGQPDPGPLLEVKFMLIADKVQNRKDFLAYHSETHPRRRELERYFAEWLNVLGVTHELELELHEVMKQP